MESDEEGEGRPLLPADHQIDDSYKSTFKLILMMDLFTSFVMYFIYLFLNPIKEIDFDTVIIPLDFLILCFARVALQVLFLKSKILVKLKTPVITSFGSILYLLVRSRFAYTIEAWFTLAFAFLFAWAECGVYIHAIIVKGQDYWNIDAGGISESGLDFVFPSSPGYATSSSPLLAPSRGTYNSPTDDPVMMGSSAPISIVMPRNHDSTLSKSFAAGYQHKRQTEAQSHDCYRFLLKRHGELLKAVKSITDGNSQEAQLLLKRQARDEILPRFGLLLVQIQMLNVRDQAGYTQLFSSLQACRDSAHLMLQIKDPQAITLALSDAITPSLHKLSRSSVTPVGSFGDSSVDINSITIENLFWKYWMLDLECCLGMSILFQGLFQVHMGRLLKGAVNIGKAYSQFSRIGDSISQYSEFNMKQSPGLGITGEAVYTLRSSVIESHSLATCCFNLLSSVAPHFQSAYLQNLGLKDDKWLAQRTLYQITLKGSVDSLAASLILLYALSFPAPGFFALCYPAEQREIMNMLASIEFKVPLIQFLEFQVSRRLGALEYEETQLKKVLHLDSSARALYLHVKFEQAILLLINMKSTDALNLLHQTWSAVLEKLGRNDASSLDVTIGIFYASVLRLARQDGDTSGLDLKVLKHINHNLIPVLSKKHSNEKIHHSEETKLYRLLISWSIEEQYVSKLLFFWLLYYRNDFCCLAGSKNCVPVLINLAIRLYQDYEAEKSIETFEITTYYLVLGTIFKYLTIHGVDSIKFFGSIFPGKKLLEASKSLYENGLESCKSIPAPLKFLGLHSRLLYELAELESLCFDNQKTSISLLEQCVTGSSAGENLRSSVKSKSLSPHPPPTTALPSFARKTSHKNYTHNPSLDSDGLLSASSVSQVNLDWGSESKISEFGFSGADQMDLDLETRCVVALNFMKQKKIC